MQSALLILFSDIKQFLFLGCPSYGDLNIALNTLAGAHTDEDAPPGARSMISVFCLGRHVGRLSCGYPLV